MENRFQKLLLSILIISAYSCSNESTETTEKDVKHYEEIKKAEWLIGEWQNISADGVASEIWEKENDSIFSGKSFFVIGGDTVSSEIISLQQNGAQLFYIPTVSGQNYGKPVKFTLSSATESQLIFENPSHDFPQKISYTRIKSDSLMAEISGTMDGIQNSIQFPYSKIK